MCSLSFGNSSAHEAVRVLGAVFALQLMASTTFAEAPSPSGDTDRSHWLSRGHGIPVVRPSSQWRPTRAGRRSYRKGTIDCLSICLLYIQPEALQAATGY